MLKKTIFTLSFIFISILSSANIPDTLTNRYATTEDANYWHNVNQGDYIFFQGNIASGEAIYAGGTVFTLSLELGKKILIWRGDYLRILIDGKQCINSEEEPTIITNLGGQVRWGYSEREDNKRTLELYNFEHLLVSGKYNPEKQTGHSDYKGHDEGELLNSGDYYKKYGLWGNPRWSGYRFNNSFSNIVRLRSFETCKVEYVAATDGGFAGFNIKTDSPDNPGRVKIDVQNCFAGWTESEGYYISFSSSAKGQDLTQLTLRNNIAAFCGAESYQTDNLTKGSVLENNIAFTGACFFRRPFQDKFQDGLHQFSFVEGGVVVRNNIMIGGNSLHQIRYKDAGKGRANPNKDKKVIMQNNFYGYSRSNISFIWEGDGVTPYLVDGNVYGPVSTPTTRDAYTDSEEWDEYFRICNTSNPITFKNITYPDGREFFNAYSCGASLNVDTIKLTQKSAPIIEFVNTGFENTTDYRKITFWSARYGTKSKDSVLINYKVGDIVYYFNNEGHSVFYKCINTHSGDKLPSKSPTNWAKITWGDFDFPPLNFSLKEGSHYEKFAMGLDYTKKVTTSRIPKGKELLKLFPLPANDQVTLILPQSLLGKSSEIKIYNSIGTIVYSNHFTPSVSKYLIGINQLKSGYYLVSVEQNETAYTSKLVIK